MNFLFELNFINSFLQFEYAKIALISTLLVSLLCGILSPMILIKEKAYIGDILTHLVFPGIVFGFFISEIFAWNQILCVVIFAFLSSYFGNILADFLKKKLNLPSDSAYVVVLTGFFGLGVLGASKMKNTKIDLERILFGDVLVLSWQDVYFLLLSLLVTTAFVYFFRKHLNAWLSDPEYALLVGFNVKLIERIFPILITIAVLSSVFTVGGLMLSSLLVLPAAIVRPKTFLNLKVVLTSLFLATVSLFLAFELDWPVGATIVVIGMFLIIVQSVSNWVKIVTG